MGPKTIAVSVRRVSEFTVFSLDWHNSFLFNGPRAGLSSDVVCPALRFLWIFTHLLGGRFYVIYWREDISVCQTIIQWSDPSSHPPNNSVSWGAYSGSGAGMGFWWPGRSQAFCSSDVNAGKVRGCRELPVLKHSVVSPHQVNSVTRTALRVTNVTTVPSTSAVIWQWPVASRVWTCSTWIPNIEFRLITFQKNN